MYLALQVKDARKQLDEQSYSTAFQTLYSAWDPVFDESNRELLFAGLTQERELSASEEFGLTLILGRILGVAQAVERADEATQAAIFPTVEFLLAAYPGGIQWAEHARQIPAFGPSFEAFDRLVAVRCGAT